MGHTLSAALFYYACLLLLACLFYRTRSTTSGGMACTGHHCTAFTNFSSEEATSNTNAILCLYPLARIWLPGLAQTAQRNYSRLWFETIFLVLPATGTEKISILYQRHHKLFWAWEGREWKQELYWPLESGRGVWPAWSLLIYVASATPAAFTAWSGLLLLRDK